MSDLARTSQGYAPLANGPLPKPSGLRMPYLNHLKKFPVPFTVASFGVWAVTLYFWEFKKMDKAMEYARNVKNIQDKEFEQSKEFGVFKSVKASWQLEDDD